VFDFDHVHFDSSIGFGSPVAILYGALGTDCFKEFHVALVEAAKQVHSVTFCLWLYYYLNVICFNAMWRLKRIIVKL
jgi:hypothetical protein